MVVTEVGVCGAISFCHPFTSFTYWFTTLFFGFAHMHLFRCAHSLMGLKSGIGDGQ